MLKGSFADSFLGCETNVVEVNLAGKGRTLKR